MTRIVMFLFMLAKEIQKDDLISVANDLTYKVLLAIFPFIIFLLALVGYFEMDANYLLTSLSGSLPDDIVDFITPFFIEIIDVKRPSILSTSLIFMIYSASSGFNSVIKCINKAYGHKDERNIVHIRTISVILVITFAVAIIVSMAMLIFNDNIYKLILDSADQTGLVNELFNFFGYIIGICVLLVTVMLINRLSLARKVSFRDVLPGSVTTVVFWAILSKGFNIYVNNFNRYSTVYGSVAGIMLFMIWLNLICLSLLIGAEINAMLKVEK